jgi:hypothetical protein
MFLLFLFKEKTNNDGMTSAHVSAPMSPRQAAQAEQKHNVLIVLRKSRSACWA